MLDIEDKKFWRATYTIVQAKFPALRVIRYYDSNTPAMFKLFHLYHRTTLAIERSCDIFNNVDLFVTYDGTSDCLEFKETDVFRTTAYSTTSEDNSKYASSDYDSEPTNLGSNIIFEW